MILWDFLAWITYRDCLFCKNKTVTGIGHDTIGIRCNRDNKEKSMYDTCRFFIREERENANHR